jgi:hypothetical protein
MVLPYGFDSWPEPFVDWASVACSADGSKMFAMGLVPGDDIGPIPFYFSTDEGASWTNTEVAKIWRSLAVSADGTKIASVYDQVGIGLLLSTNSGSTWNGTSASNLTCIAWSEDGKTLVAGGELLGISTKDGAAWSYFEVTNAYWSSVATSADGSKLVAAVLYFHSNGNAIGPGVIYTSKDFGNTWAATSAPSNRWVSVACSADGTKLAAAASNCVYTSSDSGTTWISNNVTSGQLVAVASSADGCRLVAADAGDFSNNGHVYIFQATPKPSLSMMASGGDMLVSWTVPSMPFVLEKSPSLNGADWTEVTAEATFNYSSLRNEVRLQSPAAQVFYRLKSR